MSLSFFNAKKYFFITEYIISDLKNIKETNEKKLRRIKSFNEIDNVLSRQRVSVDVSKLDIQNNNIKSIRIKS